MSVLTKVPYILTIMLTLSKAEKEAFAEALDTSVENFVEVGFLKEDKKISELTGVITCVALRTDYDLPRKLGYLIKKSSKTHFLCFSDTPGKNQLTIYEVVGVSLVKVNEFLDAEELRNILTDEGQSEVEITPAALLEVMEGDTVDAGVNVDLSEDNQKVKITLDQDVKDKLANIEIDEHTVTINDQTISLQQFINNCEAGNYTTVGTIATMHNLIDGKDFRIILIGVDHDVLSTDGTTKAKTTWHFYDMPINNCKLGLPFNVIDWGSSIGRAAANAYLDGTNTAALTWYPSNKAGYPTATGLMNSLHVVYEALPMLLRNAIKMVRKNITIPRSTRSIAEEGGTESDSSQNTYIDEMLFHLSAKEAGSTSYGSEGTTYAHMSSNENRIRYYNGSARHYWLRTLYPSYSHGWVIVGTGGSIGNGTTSDDFGVAPAFCI